MIDAVPPGLAYGLLILLAIAVYLRLNKLWARKHVSEVAESISIPGIVLEFIVLFAIGIYLTLRGEMVGLLDGVLWLLSATILIIIGSGFWVSGQRQEGIWRLVKDSISREREELSLLAREFVSPSAAPQLIKVLTSMAAVDGVIDERERVLIDSFAKEWRLDFDLDDASIGDSSKRRLVNTQRALKSYLKTSPPPAQVAELLDVLHLVIDVDEETTEEEQVAYDEISGQVSQYLSDDPSAGEYVVVIAPQGDEQDEAIRLVLKRTEEYPYAGGKGYKLGVFFSRAYANVICKEYRALGFFTVVIYEPGKDPS